MHTKYSLIKTASSLMENFIYPIYEFAHTQCKHLQILNIQRRDATTTIITGHIISTVVDSKAYYQQRVLFSVSSSHLSSKAFSTSTSLLSSLGAYFNFVFHSVSNRIYIFNESIQHTKKRLQQFFPLCFENSKQMVQSDNIVFN